MSPRQMFDHDVPRGVVPSGRYAQQARSPIVWVFLCSTCGGFAPMTSPDYEGALSGTCGGCGNYCRELHRFRAFIDSASGCGCPGGHPRIVGELSVAETATEASRA